MIIVIIHACMFIWYELCVIEWHCYWRYCLFTPL